MRPPRTVPLTVAALLLLVACSAEDSPVGPIANGPKPSFDVVTYDCSLQSEIPSTECDALVAFYQSTNGPGWTASDGWLVTDQPCSWYGIECDVYLDEVHVSAISFSRNSLSGPLPPEIGDLAYLENLRLFRNAIAGPIPQEIGQLSNLHQLTVAWNYSSTGATLTGGLPAEMANLTELVWLSFERNGLSGELPTWVAGFEHLRTLALAFNEFEGPIPHGYSALTNLESLRLGRNHLTGVIPSWLGDLPELSHIYLEGRGYGLTGGLPDNLQNLDLETLAVGQNNLTIGQIPEWLQGMERLDGLSLDKSGLTGEIPAWLALLPIGDLALNNNQLTGSIPPVIGDMAGLRTLYLYRNELTGQIPPELGKLQNVWAFELWGNQLSGPIPAELGNMEGLYGFQLFDNNLSGLVPLEAAVRGGIVQEQSGNPRNCRWAVPGNEGLYMPDTQPYRDADLDGDGYICSVPVTATPATVATDLGSGIENLQATDVVNKGQARALSRKIDHAMELYAKDKYGEAIEVVQGFIQQVNDLTYVDLVLTEEQAEPLIDAASVLIELIELDMST